LFRIVQFSVYFLLGVIVYAFSFYIISDVLRIFIKINPHKEGIIVFALAITVAALGYLNTRLIRESNYTIYSDKIKHAAKIVMVSDIHIGSPDMTLSKFQRMVQKINAQNADFVILAGDIVDDASVNYKKLGYENLFKSLQAKHGVYATIGNHENYRGDVHSIVQDLTSDGIKVLDNSAEYFAAYNLNILGITDVSGTSRQLAKVVDFNLDSHKFNLVVEHNPIRFSEAAEDNVDLQLSGHTHGGQMLHGWIITQLMYPKPRGQLDLNGSSLITGYGVGTWGPPIRDITYPEIIIINVEPR
jgi:predicted MPP superfamily phosphohydrolase